MCISDRDTALYTIEKNNPALKGALPDNYYSRLHIDTAKLASLLDEINRINTDDKENDIIGRVYEDVYQRQPSWPVPLRDRSFHGR